jgi:hypothetical protein
MAKKAAAASPGVPIDRTARIERGKVVLDLIQEWVSDRGRTKAESALGPGPRDVTPATRRRYWAKAVEHVAEQQWWTEGELEVDARLARLLQLVRPEPRFANATQTTLADAITTGRLPLTRESLDAFLDLPDGQLLDALSRTLDDQI